MCSNKGDTILRMHWLSQRKHAILKGKSGNPAVAGRKVDMEFVRAQLPVI